MINSCKIATCMPEKDRTRKYFESGKMNIFSEHLFLYIGNYNIFKGTGFNLGSQKQEPLPEGTKYKFINELSVKTDSITHDCQP